MGGAKLKLFPSGKGESILATALYAITGLVYLPLGFWLYRQTTTHEQLLQALIVFVFTGLLIFYERRASLQFKIGFRSSSQNLLLAGYLFIALSVVFNSGLVFLVSFCLVLASGLDYLFGPKILRKLVPMLIGLAVFLLIILLLPALDWPLRSLAGQCAAFGLETLGQESALRLIATPEGPKLLLLSGGSPFHVAAECNGFRILSSSLLMATLLPLYERKRSPMPRLLLVLASGLMAFLFNGLRIVVIVLLAPRVGAGNYDLMHEAVGTVLTYTCLFLVYLLFRKQKGLPADQREALEKKESQA